MATLILKRMIQLGCDRRALVPRFAILLALIGPRHVAGQELLPPVPPEYNMMPFDDDTDWLPEPRTEFDSLDLIRRMGEFRLDMSRKKTELNLQLDRLEDILREHPACNPTDEEPVPTPAPPPPPPEGNVAVAPPDAGATDATETLPSIYMPPQPVDPPPDTSSIWDHDAILDTITVTENAINRLALANNLYAAGEIEIALKIYNQLRLENKTKNQAWVVYQIAHCHRRLGNKPQADQAFRIVSAMPYGEKWSKYAQWWLNNGDGLATIDTKSAELADAVTRLKGIVENAEPN